MWPYIKALLVYRDFILGTVKREFQLKYRNSILGVAWTIINPLAMIVVYTVIFSQVMRAKLPGVEHEHAYSVYLCAGFLTWGLFAEIVGRGQNIFLENANLLKKVSFPHLTLPLIIIISAVVNFAIIFGLFLVFLLIAGLWPGWVVFAVIPVLIIQLIFAIGLGISLGVINVFIRDIGHFFSIFLQFWFWFTPIVYLSEIVPEKIKPFLIINPMYSLVSSYQDVFVNSQWPNWSSLIYPLALGFILCVVGFYIFRRYAGEMLDEL